MTKELTREDMKRMSEEDLVRMIEDRRAKLLEDIRATLALAEECKQKFGKAPDVSHAEEMLEDLLDGGRDLVDL